MSEGMPRIASRDQQVAQRQWADSSLEERGGGREGRKDEKNSWDILISSPGIQDLERISYFFYASKSVVIGYGSTMG